VKATEREREKDEIELSLIQKYFFKTESEKGVF
jgi:hypothetical protein